MKNKIFFLSILSLVFIEIKNFHFKDEEVLDKIFLFDREHCYTSSSGKYLWWGCIRGQKFSFSLADGPEHLRK